MIQKGIFFIPVDNKHKQQDTLLDEIIDQTLSAEKWGLKEVYFGEHITDQHEKISSSLMMVSALAKLTKEIKLGTLTTNLNFFKPATISAIIAQADNLCKGRLVLGIGSGANKSDVESIDMLSKDNHKIMLETFKILEEIFYKDNAPVNIKTDNFKISTKESFNEDLGLGYFNKLYKERKNLEVIMPALNKDSYNVKICAENNWNIAISNFCSEEIIDNHIENYLRYSKLDKKNALQKIKLTKLIYVNDDDKKIEDHLFTENSPHYKVVHTIFTKLKTFNKHNCFGENIDNSMDALKQTVLYGNSKSINEKIKYYEDKYGNLSSYIYVSVPKTGQSVYDKSLELFSKNVN